MGGVADDGLACEVLLEIAEIVAEVCTSDVIEDTKLEILETIVFGLPPMVVKSVEVTKMVDMVPSGRFLSINCYFSASER